MVKTLLAAITISLAATAGALAQDRSAPTQDQPQNGGAGVRSGNITSTGETVPNPGASQSAGTTPMDRGIQREDNKIQSSICKGC